MFAAEATSAWYLIKRRLPERSISVPPNTDTQVVDFPHLTSTPSAISYATGYTSPAFSQAASKQSCARDFARVKARLMAKEIANSDALERMIAELAPIKPEAMLVEVEAVLRERPSRAELAAMSDAAIEWLGRAKAILNHWDGVRASALITIEHQLHSPAAALVQKGHSQLLALLNEARFSLRLKVDQESVVAGPGMVHEYFDGLRKIIESATDDLFFVDPYLDADFAGRYLGYVKTGVAVRLLGGTRWSSLAPSLRTAPATPSVVSRLRRTSRGPRA